ncbi:SAM-dependent chlorinase/fluorinase [Halorarum halophilum]|uniref:SAM-dependent chlorinase/fluorinase n=1 Tax=Halorarum halophilum TaxID=2743090 RepID=A0A7D5GFQ7_9EURY|nr:SAM-dependent chlorinase/fluorinase [Halobaculum halophilum]QLG26211.1 SAM-dependent chlorinase/fluorinase [Halobaculum halophilum]
MFTLASDFGSPYPAAMKGVLLSTADGDPRLVDVAHDLPRQDPRAAAFWLKFVLPEFPPAVHLAVVDPGVGTDRDALVVVAGDHAFVGPDNGSLLPPARALVGDEVGEGDGETGEVDDADTIDAGLSVFAVDAGVPRSSTFHGRDVFAPVAAAVHDAGVGNINGLDRLEPTDDHVDLRLPEADVGDGRATGEVLVVDDFGNAVTNVPGAFLDGRIGADLRVETPDGTVIAPVVETFAAVDPGQPLVTVGSHGYVECDVNRGRGEAAFGVGPGDELVLTVV